MSSGPSIAFGPIVHATSSCIFVLKVQHNERLHGVHRLLRGPKAMHFEPAKGLAYGSKPHCQTSR